MRLEHEQDTQALGARLKALQAEVEAAVAAVVGCFFSVAAGWAYRRWRKGVPAGQRRRLGSM